MLDVIIRDNWGDKVSEILDAACGIGTQCIGLTKLGYLVTASDLSPHAVKRAKYETSIRGLSVPLSVADMRKLSDHHAAQFDLVIACGNAVPHLLSDEEILTAFRQFYACTRSGGGCIITVRDYEAEDTTGRKVKLCDTHEDNGITFMIFQRWDFHGAVYDLSMYLVEDDGGAHCKTRVMRCRYYAIETARLIELVTDAGFENVSRLDRKFFQPVIIGIKKA